MRGLGTVGLLAAALLLALFAAAPGARADLYDPADWAPYVVSDKADYRPGELVTLTGGHWQAGESVRIIVNDDDGQSWRREVDVTADSQGAITDSFNLPDHFVAVYSVVATGASSGAVAHAGFTDGNVGVTSSPVGTGASEVLFDLTFTIHEGSGPTSNSNCTPTAGDDPAATETVGSTTSGSGRNDWVEGVAAKDSVRLEAATTPDQPSGLTFSHWDGPAGAFVAISPSNPRIICVTGNFTGTRDFKAVYVKANAAPAVAANNASVTVNEGQAATNSGTYSDTNSGDTVSLTASRGNVTKTGTNSGTWSWSLDTNDGSAQTGPVTITANDGNGGVTTTQFALTVDNVAPSATFNAPASVAEGSAIALSLTAPSDLSSVDTTAGFTYAFDCGSGYGAFGTASTASCPTNDNGSRAVAAKIRDKDGGMREYTATVTITNVAPSATFGAPASVDEGSAIALSLTGASDPSSADTTAGFEYAFDCGTGSGYGAFESSSTASCPTSDDGSRTVKGKVRDKDGGVREYEATVTAANVAPAVTAPDDQSSDEGEDATIDLGSFTDPGADGPWAVTVDWGDGSADTTFSEASPGAIADKSHTYADDGAYTVTVTVAEEGSGTPPSDSKTFTVTVANVEPVVAALDPQTAGEGASKEFDLGSFTDPGDDGPWAVTVDWGDGSANTTFTEASAGPITDKSYTYADNGTYTVTVTVAEAGDGPSDSVTFEVDVANVAPKVNLTGPGTAEEGETKSYSFTVTDAGADTWEFAAGYPTCGSNGDLVAGTVVEETSGGSFDCRFPDGPADTNVSVRVTDDDGATSVTDAEHVEIVPVAVANVAPAVTAPEGQSSDEGEGKTFDLGSFTDPGDDGPWAVTVDWGDGTTPTSFTEDAAGDLTDKSHTYADDGPFQVTVTVQEAEAGPTDSESFQVTVANVAPVVSPAEAQTSDEGESKSFDLGSFTDPGADGPWAVTVDWGDSSAPETFTEASAGAIADESHAYADDGTYTVTVEVAEAGGAPSDSATFVVTVANVAPVVTAAGTQTADEGTGSEFDLGSFTDPGADGPWAVTVDWGDDSADTTFSEGAPGELTDKSHTYADDGTYTVTVTVAEAGSGTTPSDSKTFDVTVANVVPVVTAPEEQSADEGTGKELDLGSFTDPGADGPWAVTVDWGDGSADTTFSEGAPGELTDKSHTYADDGAYTVTVTVAEEGENAPSDSRTFDVTVANVAPKVNLTGPDTVDEGDTETYSFTVADPGTDTWEFADGYPTCGANGRLVDGSVETTAGGGSFRCRFPDGDTTTDVRVRVVDSDGAESVADSEHVEVVEVTISNVAPAVTAAADQTADEGENKSFALGSFTDPGPDGPWSVTVDWGDGSADTTFTEAVAGSLTAKSHAYGDNGTYTVTVTVAEAGSGTPASDAKTFVVNVANVNPTASNPAFSIDPFTGSASASYDYSDAGWLDAHGSSIVTWAPNGTGPAQPAVTRTVAAPDPVTGRVSATRTFAPGCYALNVSGTARDDDLGLSAELAIASDQQASVHGRGFRPPIMDSERNVAKLGNVIPVKVQLTNRCTNANVTSAQLFITLAKGTGNEAIEDTNLVAESVSNADTGAQMRIADGMYIYNLSTKGLVSGSDYTVRVRLGSTTGDVLLQAVIQPKK